MSNSRNKSRTNQKSKTVDGGSTMVDLDLDSEMNDFAVDLY